MKLAPNHPRLRLLLCGAFWLWTASAIVEATAHAAEVESDGGITLFVSYDSSQPQWSGDFLATLNETDGDSTAASNCMAPTEARGAPSPGSCATASGSSTCTGIEKLRGDLRQLARYIYRSTHGAHYLKRVFVADRGRFWGTADILWDLGQGASEPGSSTAGAGWRDLDTQIRIRNARRTCIHDVAHHEIGHYLYGLPDRYIETQYSCILEDDSIIQRPEISIKVGDPNTVMNAAFPHDFVDEGNAALEVEYDGQTKTLDLAHGFGPNRADWPAYGLCKFAFGLDEWSMLAQMHVDLDEEAHTVGSYPEPDFDAMEALGPEICEFPSDEPVPGILVLIDRTEQAATKAAEEAALYLFHSSQEDSYVGAFAYDLQAEPIFAYGRFDADDATTGFDQQPPFFTLPTPSASSTNLGATLETALDALESAHTGDCGPAGASIVLMSDGQGWTGNDALWAQVDRAAALGVAIHTLSYGSADDTTTMNAIAESSSGSVTLVSGSQFPLAYKLDMIRTLNRLRGYHQVLNGNLDSATFTVPHATKALIFYVFLQEGDPDDLEITLEHCPEDDSCQPIAEDAGLFPEKFPELANRGGFRGVRIANSQAGLWKYTIQPVAGKPKPKILHVMASIRNPAVYALSFQLAPPKPIHQKIEWPEPHDRAFADTEPHEIGTGLQASVRYRYPLTGVRVLARVYDGLRHVMDVPLRDGGKGAFDPRRDDGIYSTPPTFRQDLANALRKANAKPEKVRVEVELIVDKNSFPANAPYEPGTRVASLARDYAGFIGMNAHAFSVSTTTTIDLHPIDRDPRIVFVKGRGRELERGRRGRLVVGIDNARPLKRHLRVSLGQGVTVKDVAIRTLVRGRADVAVVIDYETSRAARPGARDLVLQFGKTILGTSKGVVVVANGRP